MSRQELLEARAAALRDMKTVRIEKKDKKTGEVKVKNYIMVNDRIKAFREIYPDGLIKTTLLEDDGDRVTFLAEAFDETGRLLSTGHAFEQRQGSFINQSSYIENCETSAIGRCLGALGIGIDDSMASADELANAISNQEELERQEKAKKPINKIEAKSFRSWLQENGLSEEKIVAKAGKPIEKMTLGEHKYFINHLEELKEEFGA